MHTYGIRRTQKSTFVHMVRPLSIRYHADDARNHFVTVLHGQK